MDFKILAGEGHCENDALAAVLTRVATLLLSNGQTTEATRLAVERLAGGRGCSVKFAARWDEFVLQAADRTLVGEVMPTGVDISRVALTEAVVDAVSTGGMEVGEGLARLEVIGRSNPVALARFAPMAAAGAAALGVIFGAPDWPTIGLIAASAACGALLRRAVSHVSANPFVQPFSASLLAGLVGGLVARSGLTVVDRLVIVCPCMVLVPGPHFLNGCLDLARARIPIGAGRVGLALLIVLAICGGLFIGLAMTGTALPKAGTSVGVRLGYDMLAAGVAVAAYGSFFNMPWRLMMIPILVGMTAHALRWQLMQHGASLQVGAFAATLLVGVVITPLAHRYRIPFGASAFAAVVSLIPGVIMFDAASAVLALIDLGANADSASLLPIVGGGATAVVVVLAMAAGLILPKLVFDSFWVDRDR